MSDMFLMSRLGPRVYTNRDRNFIFHFHKKLNFYIMKLFNLLNILFLLSEFHHLAIYEALVSSCFHIGHQSIFLCLNFVLYDAIFEGLRGTCRKSVYCIILFCHVTFFSVGRHMIKGM